MKSKYLLILVLFCLPSTFAQYKLEINQNQKSKEYLTKLMKDYISEDEKMKNDDLVLQIIRIDEKISKLKYNSADNMIQNKNAKGIFQVFINVIPSYIYFLFIYKDYLVIIPNRDYCELIKEISRYLKINKLNEKNKNYLSGRIIDSIMKEVNSNEFMRL